MMNLRLFLRHFKAGLSLAFIFCGLSAFAQYPNAPNKIGLGRQTTGDGLVFRTSGKPVYTPTTAFNAWMALDTTTGNLWTYRGGEWFLEVAGDLRLVYPVVINKSGVDIKQGQVVMVDTVQLVQGDQVRVRPAIATVSNSQFIMGVASTDINNDATGYISWFGYVREVDHADIAQTGVTLDVGDILYISATEAGKYTDTEPTAPNVNSTIALVVRKPNANNMTLLVRPWLNEKLGDLRDVDLSGIANGQGISWDSVNQKFIPATFGSGSVTSIATNNGITGGTITTSGTIGLTGQALALHNIGGTGFFTRGAGGSIALRSIDAGTGISISDASGLSGNPTITNSAPDQTVVLTAGTGISTSGTYPNFTITNSAPDQTVVLTAGTGISTSGSYPNFTITNSAPDQVVSITGAGINAVTGTYPNFTITATEVDGSITNEGVLGVGAGGANTAVITSNTSGATGVTINGGVGALITETTSTNGGTINVLVDTANIVSKTFLTNQGYTSNTGTVTSIATGYGLDGGTITTTGTLSVDTLEIATPYDVSLKQDKLTGTGLVKSTSGTISYITDNSTNWDAAYNDRITSAAFSGSGTKTLTLTQQDAGTITASFTDLQGVTSVTAGTGLSGGAITTTGTISADTSILSTKWYAADTASGVRDWVVAQGYTSNVGTVTSIATNNGITGGTITSSGTIGLTGQALALHNLSTNGLIARTGAGTVAGRTITAGTGISVTNGDGISANPTITNSAPDQTVVLTAGTGINTSGTYPNFTITNSAPDQTVSITGAGINAVTGTYPNFTVTGTEVDGSVSNEGTLGVGAGGANTAVINSNTSGATGVTIAGGTNVTITESTSSNGGTITVNASGGDSGWFKFFNNYITPTESKPMKFSGSDSLYIFANSFSDTNYLAMSTAYLSDSIDVTTKRYDLLLDIDMSLVSSVARLADSTAALRAAFPTTIYSGNGTLSAARTISTNGNKLTISGSNTAQVLEINNTNTGTTTNALTLQSFGPPLQATRLTSSTGSILPVSDYFVNTSSTAAAGLGGFHRFYIEDAGGLNKEAGRIGFRTSDAAGNSYDSEAFISVRKDSSELKEGVTLLSTGQLHLKEYGDTLFTGTAVKYLAVDDDGKVIEVDGAAGTVTSIATNNGITGGTITSSGTIGLTGQALALHNLATNGIIARTGAGTVAGRTITAGTGISITNGDGVSGNPAITNSLPEATTARNINATGEGIYRAEVGNELQFKRLVAGSNITLTGADSTITIASTASGSIKGTGAANKVAIWASADSLYQNTNLHWDNGNGRLGINNTSPSERLHVGGNVLSERLIINTSGQTTSITNYKPTHAIGENFFIGGGGLNSLSHPDTTFLGSFNTGIGLNSLFSNTQGFSNTAIGGYSLYLNTRGFANVAIGGSTLFFNTTGNENLAIANNALQNNLTGSQNIGIGTYSLNTNTSGSYNTAIGTYGLYGNTTGSTNIAIGAFSLFSNTTAIKNIGIGLGALFYNTTGSNSVAIGSDAGSLTNTGANNVTSGNSVYIGQDARPSASGNTNEIVIGYEGRGQGSNTAIIGNSSITNTYLRGKVSINTTANVNTLDVEGGAAIGATYSGTNTAPTNGLIVEGRVGIGFAMGGSTTNKFHVNGNAFIGSLSVVNAAQNGLTVQGKTSIGGGDTTSVLNVYGSISRGLLRGVATPTYTVALIDSWIRVDYPGTCELTLPNPTTFAGREIMISTITANTVISNASNVVPITGGAAGTAILPATDGAWCTLVSDGNNWVIMQRGS